MRRREQARQCILGPAALFGLSIEEALVEELLHELEKQGYDVVTVRATPDGRNAKVTPFLTGFLDKSKNEFWGRPVDVLQLPDGSLLVADEQMGAIYRVSYKR